MTRRWMLVLCLVFAQYGLRLAETGMCPAGTYLAEHGTCVKCPEGSYTEHSNQLPRCSRCRDCESGLVEVSPCTPMRNTECGCEIGKCLTDDSPEHCVPCPRPVTRQQTSTATSGNLAPSRDPSRPRFRKPSFPRQDATLPSLNKQPDGTGNIWTTVGDGLVICIVLVELVMLVLYTIYLCKKDKSQGFLDFWKNSLGSVWAWCRGHPRTASEIGQNDLNERENLTEIESYDKRQDHDGCLLDRVDSVGELESQAQAPFPAETAQALGDPEQVPTGAGQSQERRRCLVPVEGTNGAETQMC